MATNNNSFINGFVAKINELVTDKQLRKIKNQLDLYCANYSIELKEFQVSLLGELPTAYKDFLASKKVEGLSDTTLSDYKLKLDKFFQEVRFPLAEITTQDIQVFLFNYSKGYTRVTAHTMNQYLAVINNFFQWSADNGYISKNPCASISRIKYEKKEIEVITPEDMAKLLNACDNARDKAIISLLSTTGVRVSELVGIAVEDIAWDTTEDTYAIRVLGKGNKERYVFMTTQCALYVLDYIQEKGVENGKLFNYSTRTIQYIVENCGERIGISGLHPHTLRHSVATELASKGTSINLVQKMLGHSSSSTTTKYYVKSEYKQLQKEISSKLS